MILIYLTLDSIFSKYFIKSRVKKKAKLYLNDHFIGMSLCFFSRLNLPYNNNQEERQHRQQQQQQVHWQQQQQQVHWEQQQQ